jgi:hypothetical protein
VRRGLGSARAHVPVPHPTAVAVLPPPKVAKSSPLRNNNNQANHEPQRCFREHVVCFTSRLNFCSLLPRPRRRRLRRPPIGAMPVSRLCPRALLSDCCPAVVTSSSSVPSLARLMSSSCVWRRHHHLCRRRRSYRLHGGAIQEAYGGPQSRN